MSQPEFFFEREESSEYSDEDEPRGTSKPLPPRSRKKKPKASPEDKRRAIIVQAHRDAQRIIAEAQDSARKEYNRIVAAARRQAEAIVADARAEAAGEDMATEVEEEEEDPLSQAREKSSSFEEPPQAQPSLEWGQAPGDLSDEENMPTVEVFTPEKKKENILDLDILPDNDNSAKRRKVKCKVCGAMNIDLSQCNGCKTTVYCSVSCQSKDWISGHHEQCH